MPFGRRRTGRQSLQSYVKDLSRLGLAGKTYDWTEMRDRVETCLKIRIWILAISPHEHPDRYEWLLTTNNLGYLWRHPDTHYAEIWYRADLPDAQRKKTIMHELEHIICGHELPVTTNLADLAGSGLARRLGNNPCLGMPGAGRLAFGRISKVSKLSYKPPRWVARGRPPADRNLCESEAELRADWAILCSELGPDVYRSDDWFFGRY